MIYRRVLLITFFILLPPEFWSAVISRFIPSLENILNILYHIGLGILLLVVSFIIAANILISCIVKRFKNRVMNGLLFTSLATCGGGYFYSISKMELMVRLFQKFLPGKFLRNLSNFLRNVIIDLLIVIGTVTLIIRAVCFIVMYIVNYSNKKELAA